MPPPIFFKPFHPLGTFAFSQTYVFPVLEEETPNQSIGYSLGGPTTGHRAISVINYGGTENTITLAWRNLPLFEVRALRAWLRDGAIQYANNPFTFVDHEGTMFTVRYVAGVFPVAQTSYQTVGNFALTLRIES